MLRQRENREQEEENTEEQLHAEAQCKIEDQERNLKANIFEIQKAIADAAALCGRPKRRTLTKLEHDHPAMCDLAEALTLRSMSMHPLAGLALSNRVVQCIARLRTLASVAQAEFVFNNPRMPRRRIVAQHRIRALRGTEEGAEDNFDAEQRGKLLTDFYENLFEARKSRRICLSGWT